MRTVKLLCLVVALGCARSGPPPAAALDTRNDACAFCRMAVSDARFAAQVVAPGEEPRFFDDLGCLLGFIAQGALPRGAVLYVADHRTRTWVATHQAVFTRNPALMTPMASHLLAHADAASQQADPDTRGGVIVPWAELTATAATRPGAAR